MLHFPVGQLSPTGIQGALLKLPLGVASAIVLGVLLSLPVAAQMGPPITPFSADLHVSSSHGESMNGKMYFTTGHMRMDMEGGPHGGANLITNMATQTTDMLMPQQHMYMEFKADQAMMRRPGMMPSIKPFSDPGNPCAGETGATCKKVGVEDVNGRTCDHWQITQKNGSVSNVWVDQKLHFPIKSVSPDSTWELTNIQEGEPDASLFVIPSGYRKMDVGGMMQGRQPPAE
jgi:hypothetical protein